MNNTWVFIRVLCPYGVCITAKNTQVEIPNISYSILNKCKFNLAFFGERKKYLNLNNFSCGIEFRIGNFIWFVFCRWKLLLVWNCWNKWNLCWIIKNGKPQKSGETWHIWSASSYISVNSKFILHLFIIILRSLKSH
jgi:hypothetical protein